MSYSYRTLPLFYDLQAVISSSDTLQKYDAIFCSLDLSRFPNRRYRLGRTGYSRHAILRAFIIKHLERIASVPRLIDHLDGNPVLAAMCGFEPACLPDASQFYRFLDDTPNSQLQKILHRTSKKLIDDGHISGKIFIIDSKPILAATKHNNLKNPNRKLYKAAGPPKRNPKATLGYYSYQKISDGDAERKRFTFFWGYRTHVIVNVQGIPLVEITLPNNQTDATVAKRLIKRLKRIYGSIRGKIVIGDKAYDVKELYELIVTKLKAQAFIPINPRNQKQRTEADFDKNGIPVCPAGLAMACVGRCDEPHRKRLKYRCPIKADAKVHKEYNGRCPADEPHFELYGCTRYVDVTNDARAQVPRGTDLFKKTYRLRQTVEQYFARYGDPVVEQTQHYKLQSIQNQMTIGHLSMALVAAAAIKLKRPDKIRCWRTFAKSAA